MDKIYDLKTKKLVEVSLTPGEQLVLLKENNRRVREQTKSIAERAVKEVSCPPIEEHWRGCLP